MTDNITLLTSVLRKNQFGFARIVAHSTKTVERLCPVDCVLGDDCSGSYLENIPVETEVASGLLRNYTVRDADILLTVLPWNKDAKSFDAGVKLRYDRRETFNLEHASTLVRRHPWGDLDLSIELTAWSPTRW
jgi:hypothetical protein